MTTIIWDGRTLAADKQTNLGGMKGLTTKIRRVNGALVGVCGDGAAIQMFADWLQMGGHAERYPRSFLEGDSCAMEVRGDGKVRIYEKGYVPMVMDQNHYAIGSGREFAMGALACGKTAREALAVAASLDCYTGATSDELRFTTDRKDPND